MFLTLFNLFEFLPLPFGLGNAAQRMMDKILGDLPLRFMYLANILVFSSSFEDYQLNLLMFWIPATSPSTWRSVFCCVPG